MPTNDPEKNREYVKRHYEKNRKQITEKNRRSALVRRNKLRDLKRHPCTDCGKSYPPFVMQWDHRPGEEKIFQVSRGGSKSWEDVLAEVAKCDLVCANCHAYRTASRNDWTDEFPDV